MNIGPQDEFMIKLIDAIGYDAALSKMADLAGYWSVPPSITEFLDDTYYAGSFLGESLYPAWREILQEVFPSPFYSPYLEICATGSIGTGKSTMCLAGMLYDLCCLLHLKDPHDKFKLIKSTQIVFAFINTTLTLSQSVLFNQFREWVDSSPFFKEQRAYCRSKREFLPHNIGLLSGSRGSHALGRAVVSGILSELNFQGVAVKEQAYKNYTNIRRRMESRFMRGENVGMPGRLWLDSSKSDESGFLEQHLKNLYDDPKGKVVCRAVWEVLGPAGKVNYSGDKFKAFIGDATRDPFILSGIGSAYGIPEHLVIDVPIEYKKSFEQDIHGSLRDIAGVSVWGAHKYLPQTQVIPNAMHVGDGDSRQKRINPCERAEIDLDFDDGHDRLINYIHVDHLDKNTPYFVHMDLGLKRDRTGIAFTRSKGEVVVDRYTNAIIPVQTRDMAYSTDLVLAVIAKPGKEVPISKIKNFLVDLQKQRVHIAGVSADGYQSANILQDLRMLGFPTELISVDKTREPYDLFKNTLLEGRWTGGYHPILEKELYNLIDTGKKIDHEPETSTTSSSDRPSKDLADAVVGSLWNCKEKSVGTKAATAFTEYMKAMDQANRQCTSREELLRYNKPKGRMW